MVLKELVDNSLSAYEEDGVAPEIVISVAKGVITVADNGPGIAPDTVTATTWSTRPRRRRGRPT